VQEGKKENNSPILDLLEDTRVLRHTHAEQLFRPPVFIENVVGVLPEFLHVRSYKHLAKLDKVAMFLVIDFDDTPWVRPPANMSVVWCDDDLIRTDHGKRNFARDFLRFCYSLLIFVLVGGGLEDVNIMISYICKNLGLM